MALRALLLLLVCRVASAGPHVLARESYGDGQVAGCATKEREYNSGLATASIFIMLGVSLVGSIIPLQLSRVGSKLVGVTIKVGSFAGSGVILATALVHVLLPANEYLTSPCLPPAWRGYEASAFAICTATVVLLQILDYYLDCLLERHEGQGLLHHHHHHDGAGGHGACEALLEPRGPYAPQQGPCVKHEHCHDLECGGRALLLGGSGPQQDQHHQQSYADIHHRHDQHQHHHSHNHRQQGQQHDQQQQQQEKLQQGQHAQGALGISRLVSICFTEAAIALHSVILGVALGITPAAEFKTLLLALCFHQFLEGFALGSAVVDAGFGAAKTHLMAVFYSLTTPLGIAVGIGVRHSFNSNAAAALLLEGVLDSVCAGVLLYVVLSGPMNATKSCRGWLRQQGAAVHLACFGAFAGGAAAMALIGKWA